MTHKPEDIVATPMEEAGSKPPHVHRWQVVDWEYIPNPTWLLKRTRYLTLRCCGVRQLRITKQVTQLCVVCEAQIVTTEGEYSYCPVCGGIQNKASYEGLI